MEYKLKTIKFIIVEDEFFDYEVNILVTDNEYTHFFPNDIIREELKNIDYKSFKKELIKFRKIHSNNNNNYYK